jgi:hypothetical protein
MMKMSLVLSTAVFALLALFWTGGAALAAWLVHWAAQALADGGAVAAGREFASLPVPQWIAPWVDPALVQAARSALLWTMEAARDLLPLAGSAAQWLAPVVWVVWGLGLLVLLAAAGGLHLVLRRLRPRERAA